MNIIGFICLMFWAVSFIAWIVCFYLCVAKKMFCEDNIDFEYVHAYVCHTWRNLQQIKHNRKEVK